LSNFQLGYVPAGQTASSITVDFLPTGQASFIEIPTQNNPTCIDINKTGFSLGLKITSPEGLGMSAERITVSTAGIAKMIKKLADDNVRFNLALSLHAANDTKRNMIMPINESNNLQSLIDALNYFYKQTKSEITLEYILFDNFNDSFEDADNLIKIYRQIPADLVNIIEYNPIEYARFKKPTEEKTAEFMRHLEKNRVNARLRKSRGKDIDAACGQLANK
jgi:23S rRNA (adenine2503-C2)-methyltransferase